MNTDPEGDTITWSAVGADAARFEIVGGELRFRAPPDFRRQPRRRPPRSHRRGELQPDTAVGAAVTATDTDAQDRGRLAYTLSGAPPALFTIDSTTGQIRVGPGTVLDHEAAVRSYSVTVITVDPSGGRDDINVTINITNVNEPPIAQHDTAATARRT